MPTPSAAAERNESSEYVDPTLALAALGLDEDERNAIRLATQPNGMVAMERIELLHFLGYPEELPRGTTARVSAVIERILRNRGYGA